MQTNQNGLTLVERAHRLAEQGENVISEKQQLPKWRKISKHFTDLLMVVLMVAAILKAISGDFAESGIIFAVVVINGIVGYWQERKAEASLNGLKQMMGKETTIYLHGRRKKVPVASLVAGDLVVLGPGDVMPADLRLMETHDLVIEEAILTGESEPVQKQHHMIDGGPSLAISTIWLFPVPTLRVDQRQVLWLKPAIAHKLAKSTKHFNLLKAKKRH